MLDARLRPLIDPPLNAIGARLSRFGIGANQVTIAGFVLGIAAATAIAMGHFFAGLVLLLASRLCDGLDGAVARAAGKTDLGGYLDIVLDFGFYGAVPFGFALADPASNAVAAAALILSFYINGASFLAFAAIAEKRRLSNQHGADKSFFFPVGLAEATETLVVFVAMCLWPQAFAWLAYGFAVLTGVTTLARVASAVRAFR
jgi:phosphatidylglycerophosphate synthase